MEFIYFFIYLTSILYVYTHSTEEEINSTIDDKIITCGSILRIQNILTGFYLHSHDLTWGSGSRQQSITSVRDINDPNSLWIIKEKNNEIPCQTGSPIKCNDIIRLEHVNTGKNLHSHLYPSFITESQEASGFGENGNGDDNDNFKIVCDNDILKGKTNFKIFHIPTKNYLYVNYRKSLFNEYNCRGCPIIGQREVSLNEYDDGKQNIWKIVGGMIFNEIS